LPPRAAPGGAALRASRGIDRLGADRLETVHSPSSRNAHIRGRDFGNACLGRTSAGLGGRPAGEPPRRRWVNCSVSPIGPCHPWRSWPQPPCRGAPLRGDAAAFAIAPSPAGRCNRSAAAKARRHGGCGRGRGHRRISVLRPVVSRGRSMTCRGWISRRSPRVVPGPVEGRRGESCVLVHEVSGIETSIAHTPSRAATSPHKVRGTLRGGGTALPDRWNNNRHRRSTRRSPFTDNPPAAAEHGS
jgi:hypothetical protein